MILAKKPDSSLNLAGIRTEKSLQGQVPPETPLP